jgi:hypothetical protein
MPETMMEEGPEESADQLGTAAALLFHRGETEIVELLVQVEKVDYDWLENDLGRDWHQAHLRVDVSLFDSFTDDACEKIREAFASRRC